MSKPSWGDSPIWAEWLSMYDDGVWYWSTHKPEIHTAHNGKRFWMYHKGRITEKVISSGHKSDNPNNWENQLEARP